MVNGHVARITELPPHSPAPGIAGRAIFGEQSMMALVEFEPNAVALPHRHPQEQLGVVTRGEQKITIDGVQHDLGAGDAYFVPANVLHASTAGPDGSTCIEAFQPIREDYLRASQGLPSTPYT